eukprot:394869-Prorocentrum_minimum.AAC.6
MHEAPSIDPTGLLSTPAHYTRLARHKVRQPDYSTVQEYSKHPEIHLASWPRRRHNLSTK